MIMIRTSAITLYVNASACMYEQLYKHHKNKLSIIMIMISTMTPTTTRTMKNLLGEKSESTNLFGLLAPLLLSPHLR